MSCFELNTLSEDEMRKHRNSRRFSETMISSEQMDVTQWIMQNMPRAHQCVSIYDGFINHTRPTVQLKAGAKLQDQISDFFSDALQALSSNILEHLLCFGFAVVSIHLPSDDPWSVAPRVPVPVTLNPVELTISKITYVDRRPEYRVINSLASRRNRSGTENDKSPLYDDDGVLLVGRVIVMKPPDSKGNINSPVRKLLSGMAFGHTVKKLVLLATELGCHPPIVTEETEKVKTNDNPAIDIFHAGQVADYRASLEHETNKDNIQRTMALIDMSKAASGLTEYNYPGFSSGRANAQPFSLNFGGGYPVSQQNVQFDSLSGLMEFPINPQKYPTTYGHLGIVPGRKVVQGPRVTAPNYFIQLLETIDREIVRAMGIPNGLLENSAGTGIAYNANFMTIFIVECQRYSKSICQAMQWFFEFAFEHMNLQTSAEIIDKKEEEKKKKKKKKEKETGKENTDSTETRSKLPVFDLEEALRIIKDGSRVIVSQEITIDFSTIMLLWEKGLITRKAMERLLHETTGISRSDLDIPEPVHPEENPPKKSPATKKIPDTALGKSGLEKVDTSGPSPNTDKGHNFDTKKSNPNPLRGSTK